MELFHNDFLFGSCHPAKPSLLPRAMALSILITGGTGFVGSAIVDALQQKHPDWALTVLDVEDAMIARSSVRYIKGDVTLLADVNEAIEQAKPAVIIHTAGLVPALAARYGRKDRDKIFRVNVEGTRNMLAAAKDNDVNAFVWTGSCTAVTDDMKHQYPNVDERWPTSNHSLVYGESKAAAEALVLAASDERLATCSLRPSVIFGPGDVQLIPSIHACIAKGETPWVIGSGDNMWDVTYVTNVADAHVLAAENLLSSRTAAGEAFFISNNEPIPFRDFCLAVWAQFGHYPRFQIQIPERLAIIVGTLAEWTTWLMGTTTTLSSGSVMDACGTRYFNLAKAGKVLGYKSRVGIEEGIRISCEEYAQRLKQIEFDKAKLTSSNGHLTKG